jgi:hypothetical protein
MLVSFCFDYLFCQHIFFNHLLCIMFIKSWCMFYYFVHFWLSKKWLILLIMPISPITNNINKYIFFKFETIFQSYPNTSINYRRLISIDMKNRRPNNFSNFSTIITWSTLRRISCKSNLVIQNNMDNTQRCVIF